MGVLLLLLLSLLGVVGRGLNIHSTNTCGLVHELLPPSPNTYVLLQVGSDVTSKQAKAKEMMSVGRKRNSCFIFQQVQRRSQTERARETTDRHARTHTETERETGRQRERVKETTPSRSTFIHPFTRTHSRNSKKNSTWFDNAIPQPSTAARGQQVHDGNTSLFAARYWAKKYHPHTSRHPWLPRSRHRAPGEFGTLLSLVSFACCNAS